MEDCPATTAFVTKGLSTPHWVWSPDTARLASPSYPLASCPGRPDYGLASLAGPNPLLWGWGEECWEGEGGKEEKPSKLSIAVGYFE